MTDRIESILQKFNVRQACHPVKICEAFYSWEFGKDTIPIDTKCHSKVLDQWDKQVWIHKRKPFYNDYFVYTERKVMNNLLKPWKEALNVEELKKNLTGEKFDEMKKMLSIKKSIEEKNKCVKWYGKKSDTNTYTCKRYIHDPNVPPKSMREYYGKGVLGNDSPIYGGYNTRIPHPEWDSCINKYCGTKREICNTALKKACDEMCNYPGVKPDDKRSCVQSCHKIDKRYLRKLHPDVKYPRRSRRFMNLNKSTPENLILQCIHNNNKVGYENAKNGDEADFLCKVPN